MDRMLSGKYIFAQLIEFLPQKYFQRLVMKYEGDKYVKHFSCWNQLLVMIFGQLSNRNSLRDLTNTISAHSNKSYHLGFGKSITRSNLSKANEKRNPKIFEDFAYHMFDIARKKRIVKDWKHLIFTKKFIVMIKRDLLKSVVDSCFQGKIILLLGARQVRICFLQCT